MASFMPAQRFHDFEGLTRSEWKEKCLPQWVAFQNSIDDSNRNRVRRLAMSHWHTWDDFQWIDKNLPKLTELDLSDLQDTIICDGDLPDGFQESFDARGNLTTICHGYFNWARIAQLELCQRLEKLWARHWGCDRLHDSKYRHLNQGGWVRSRSESRERILAEIRSRREERPVQHDDGTVNIENNGLDITAVIAQCARLRTLAIRGPSLDPALSRCWRPRQACLEDEGSHAHVCTIVKGLEDNAPISLRTVEFYQAEFSPRMLTMLRERTRIRRFSISFGDILRRYSPVRETDIRRDDPKDYAANHAKMSVDEHYQVYPLYPRGSCQYSISKEGNEELQFHETLDLDTFPRCKLLEWLSDEETQTFLSHWVRSLHRTEGQAGLNHVFNDADARLADSLLINREERPLAGLNHLLTRLSDAFNTCDDLSCNNKEVINDIPISFFSFINPSPNPLHHADAGIFGAAANGIDLRAFHRLHRRFGWAPLWDVDPLFAANFSWTAGIAFPPPQEELSATTQAAAQHLLAPILRGLCSLADIDVPVRLLVGNRPRNGFSASAGTGFYWGASTGGDAWEPVGEAEGGAAGSWLTHPVVDPGLFHRPAGAHFSQPPPPPPPLPSEAEAEDAKEFEDRALYAGLDGRRGPRTIAACADELVVRYQDWTGTLPDGEAEPGRLLEAMLAREARGWLRWWHDCALGFTRVRRLWIRMPAVFDAYKSVRLATVLSNGVGRGQWSYRNVSVVEGGERVDFVVREWVRSGGPRDMVFTQEERGAGYQDVNEVDVGGHDWWSDERKEREGRKLWKAFFGAGKELQLPGWPEDPETQLHLSPPTLPVELITPALTPPPSLPLPPAEEEQLEPPSSIPIESGEERNAMRIPQTPPPPSQGDLEPPPAPKKPRKGKVATPKKPNTNRKRTRARRDEDEEGGETQVEKEESPTPKKPKTGKKSRWERELEALKG